MSDFSFHPWQLFVMGICIVMLFCLVSSYDIDQANDDKEIYCQMVEERTWPAYDKEVDCP